MLGNDRYEIESSSVHGKEDAFGSGSSGYEHGSDGSEHPIKCIRYFKVTVRIEIVYLGHLGFFS